MIHTIWKYLFKLDFRLVIELFSMPTGTWYLLRIKQNLAINDALAERYRMSQKALFRI